MDGKKQLLVDKIDSNLKEFLSMIRGQGIELITMDMFVYRENNVTKANKQGFSLPVIKYSRVKMTEPKIITRTFLPETTENRIDKPKGSAITLEVKIRDGNTEKLSFTGYGVLTDENKKQLYAVITQVISNEFFS